MVVPGSIPKMILSVANSLFICYFVQMELSHKTNEFLGLGIKLLVVSLSFVIIYKAIQDFSYAQWQLIFNSSHLCLLLGVAVVFSFLNWLLESLKWKVLIFDHKPIQFWTAFSETLRAHAVSMITPNKIGEFGAKASFYPKKMRKSVLKQTLTGQLYQLLATCLFGSFGLAFVFFRLTSPLQFAIGITLGILMMFGLVVYLLKPRYHWLRTLKTYLKSIADLSNKTNAKVMMLSLARYLCFSHLFFILLYFFEQGITYVEVMPVLFVVYLVSSIVPTFLLLDATLKASLSLVLLNGIIASEFILLVNLLMWIFNFGLPAVAGNLLILKTKAFVSEPKKAL